MATRQISLKFTVADTVIINNNKNIRSFTDQESSGAAGRSNGVTRRFRSLSRLGGFKQRELSLYLLLFFVIEN